MENLNMWLKINKDNLNHNNKNKKLNMYKNKNNHQNKKEIDFKILLNNKGCPDKANKTIISKMNKVIIIKEEEVDKEEEEEVKVIKEDMYLTKTMIIKILIKKAEILIKIDNMEIPQIKLLEVVKNISKNIDINPFNIYNFVRK